mgnify:FL=1|jgi:glucoselysine-6-phosphate deglycase
MNKHENKLTMFDYIQEEPICLRRQLEHASELYKPLIESVGKAEVDQVIIIASGSSSNAALCARPFMQKILNMNIAVYTPGEFVVENYMPKERTLCMVVSQSGCSTNAISALDLLREHKQLAVGVTSDLESDFRMHADLLVDYGCGRESVGYVTKGMTCLVMFLMLVAVGLAKHLGRVDLIYERALQHDFELAIKANSLMLQIAKSSYEVNRRAFTNLGVTYCVGFGQTLGICHEAALKLGETIKIPALAYECDEYAHGPNLQVTPAYSIFFVDDLGRGSIRTRNLCRISASVSDQCFYLGEATVVGAHMIAIPGLRPAETLMSPLYELPFFQYLAWHATEELGHWEEHPLMREADQRMNTKTSANKEIIPL